MLRRLAVSLAFATCCFLVTWVDLAEGQSVYFSRYNPLYTVVVPVICWEILLAAGMLGAWELCRRKGWQCSPPVRALFVFACLAALGIAGWAVLRTLPISLVRIVRNVWFPPGALVVALLSAAAALQKPHAACSFLRNCLLTASPILALILLAAGHPLVRFPTAAYADGELASPISSRPPEVRVIWVIFDELSQAIAFDARPADLQLPNLDRLRDESFCAVSARPPADSTARSMPALITGKAVLAVEPEGPGELLVQRDSASPPVAWEAIPNVFDAARAMGFNTALVGWYHPYGRVLNRSLTRCYWVAGFQPAGLTERFEALSLWDAMWDRIPFRHTVLPVIGHLPGTDPGRLRRQQRLKRLAFLLDRALEVAADPAIGLALLHLPLPHPPAVYNRATGSLTTEGTPGYIDSVALADRTLGELRQAIAGAGLAGRTALIVSADHGWRQEMWRGTADWTPQDQDLAGIDASGIPFLVKLPGHEPALRYERRFSTLVTRDIVEGILSRSLTAPAQLAARIDHSD